MNPILKFLAILLFLALAAGFILGLFLYPPFVNWFVSACIGGFVGWIGAFVIRWILSIFALAVEDEGHVVETCIKIFTLIVGIGVAIFFTIWVHPYVQIL